MQPRLREKVTTPVTEEPVTSTEAKLHASVDGADWDDFFDEKIAAARIMTEARANRSLCTRTYTAKMDCFPYVCDGNWNLSIYLPWAPLASVTSIAYLDANGDSQTLATSVYGVDIYSEPGRIYLKNGQVWPTTLDQPDAVTIVFVAGYGAASAVPENYKTAISQLVAHWYKNREVAISGMSINEVPMGWEDLLNADRVVSLV